MRLAWLLLLPLLAAGDAGANQEAFRHSPVILVPGNGGSQLWARLSDTENHWFCKRTTQAASAQLLWLQMSNLVYPAVKCLAYNLMLRKQHSALSMLESSTADNIGVESFVPGFGAVDTMQWIADWHSKYTAYFSTLVEHLVDKHGFSKNVTIRGAPYDFRRAPNEFGEYFRQLKALIEDTYVKSGGRRVVLVAHSMGGKLVLHFLHTQSQEWKDKYIKHFVTAGGAFGGVPASLLALLSGYGLGIPLVKSIWFRPVQRSWPSTHYLVPDSSVYPPDRPLVVTPSGQVYTLANMSALFARIGYADGYADYARFSRLTDVRKAPGVPATCVFGDGLPTPGELRWDGGGGGGGGGGGDGASFPDGQPTSLGQDSGDGTVSAATGRVCHQWSRGQRDRVRVTELNGAQHMAMLSDERFVHLVASIATAGGD